MTSIKTERVYRRSQEPIVWSLFGAGGMVVAFVLPPLILITGLLLPLGLMSDAAISYERILGFAQSWWGALFLLCAIALPLYHAAHRIYHGLHDLHLKGPTGMMLIVCYGTATMLSLLTLFCLAALVLKG
jgi:fumarate reductase subunit D